MGKNPQVCGSKLQAVENNTTATGNKFQATNNNPQAMDNNPQATNNNPQAMDNNPKATGNKPQVSSDNLQAVGHSPEAINAGPQTIDDKVSAAPARSRKTTNFTGSEIVTILVDVDEVEYYHHKDKLISKSPFFAACLASGMKEAQTKRVKLPEEDVEAFDCFADWIYEGSLPNISIGEPVNSTMKAWILAEKLCMPKWQNALVDHLGHIFTYHAEVKASQIAWVGENVPTSSMLSKFMMDYFAYQLAKSTSSYQQKDQDSGESVFDEEIWSAMTTSTVGNRLMLNAVNIARNPRASDPKYRPQDYHVSTVSRCREAKKG
ncbi:hypothetical protein H2204_011571 [Knufia peltigerae]|uniref:BTB domain-containing protein n=1 Tax=Knufia peltigerae TaxID=1002370 RepID=A0AA38XUA7_9EURO|nr:hypothetical protein H2204_011571 [Knufia peltigerae]